MLFLVVGITLVVFGSAAIVSFIVSRIKCRTEITAIVDRIIVKSTIWRGKTLKRFTPVFKYTVGGKEYTQKDYASVSDEKKYTIGQQVVLIIDENNPKVFRFGKDLFIIFLGIALFLVGLGLTICYFL